MDKKKLKPAWVCFIVSMYLSDTVYIFLSRTVRYVRKPRWNAKNIASCFCRFQSILLFVFSSLYFICVTNGESKGRT